MVMVKLSYRINLSWPFRLYDLLFLLGELLNGLGELLSLQQYNLMVGGGKGNVGG